MSRFIKRKLDDDNIYVACQLIFNQYGKYCCETPEELAQLVSDEFDANVESNEVIKYFELPTIEHLDNQLIYNNIFQ